MRKIPKWMFPKRREADLTPVERLRRFIDPYIPHLSAARAELVERLGVADDALLLVFDRTDPQAESLYQDFLGSGKATIIGDRDNARIGVVGLSYSQAREELLDMLFAPHERAILDEPDPFRMVVYSHGKAVITSKPGDGRTHHYDSDVETTT
jgi:hypothetical protein